MVTATIQGSSYWVNNFMCPETSHQRCCKFALGPELGSHHSCIFPETNMTSTPENWHLNLSHPFSGATSLVVSGRYVSPSITIHNLPTFDSIPPNMNPNLGCIGNPFFQMQFVSFREGRSLVDSLKPAAVPQRLQAEMKWAALAVATVALLSDGGAALKYAATGT